MNHIRRQPHYRHAPGRLLLALGICFFTLTAALLIPWPPHLLLGVELRKLLRAAK